MKYRAAIGVTIYFDTITSNETCLGLKKNYFFVIDNKLQHLPKVRSDFILTDDIKVAVC